MKLIDYENGLSFFAFCVRLNILECSISEFIYSRNLIIGIPWEWFKKSNYEDSRSKKRGINKSMTH